MLKSCEAPILENHACLTPFTDFPLEFKFNGTAVALWFDSQSTGCLEIYLDGKKIGLYTNRVGLKGDFQGRFCTLADSLNISNTHTLRLVTVSTPNTAPAHILLRAVAVDAGSKPHFGVH